MLAQLGTGRTIKQTKAPELLIRKIKAHAAAEGHSLKDVYEDAIVAFFHRRRELLIKGPLYDLYIAPPQNSKTLNVEVGTAMGKEIDKIAEKDHATASRLIYTSLIQYANNKSLL